MSQSVVDVDLFDVDGVLLMFVVLFVRSVWGYTVLLFFLDFFYRAFSSVVRSEQVYVLQRT